MPVLHTLQMSHNRLVTAKDVEHLADCHALGVLDLSHNQIDDPQVLDVFKRMRSLVSIGRAKLQKIIIFLFG